MWYPARITQAAASEPISLDEAKQQRRITSSDQDANFTRWITAARDHVERYCATRLVTQTVEAKCDSFDDMARLPEAPVQSCTIAYVDSDGNAQTLLTSIYELRADDLEAAVVLKYNQAWPSIQPGSRITLTAVVGYTLLPPAIRHALLLFVADADLVRENAKADEWSALDMLLCNHRRGV